MIAVYIVLFIQLSLIIAGGVFLARMGPSNGTSGNLGATILYCFMVAGFGIVDSIGWIVVQFLLFLRG